MRLREVGCAELVLADDDAVAGERVVSQATRGRQHVPGELAVIKIKIVSLASEIPNQVELRLYSFITNEISA